MAVQSSFKTKVALFSIANNSETIFLNVARLQRKRQLLARFCYREYVCARGSAVNHRIYSVCYFPKLNGRCGVSPFRAQLHQEERDAANDNQVAD